MIEYQNISSKHLNFKNIVSGPAPVGRILNYVKLAGRGNLKHKNGNRDLKLLNSVASAWCTEFMVGLGIISYDDSNSSIDVYPVNLTKSGVKLFNLIDSFNGDFDENSNDKCRGQLWHHSIEAYNVFKNIFLNSVVYLNLYAYVVNNSIKSIQDDVFYNKYYAFFLKYYTGDDYIPTTGSTSTGENRVPSLTQLCKFFNMLEKDGKILTFNLDSKNILDLQRKSGGENVILYGVPGAGKSWTIKNEYCSDDSKIERLVFHPDYTYSDFVGQILPKLDEKNQVTYIFTPGPFTNILKKAYLNPDENYYLVIEEVNRGNAPAIFGDIFQLLDRNVKTGSSEYSITNSDIAKEVYGDENHKVSIPSNLSILGTMNTSDQNVFTLDTAFQRRWNMRLIQNRFADDGSENEFANTKILDTSITWEKFLTEINSIILNKNIRMTSSEDKRLGTHFIAKEDLEFDHSVDEKGESTTEAKRHNKKFAEKVLKYLWDDAFKFNKGEIFDLTKVNSLEKVIEKFTSAQGDKRFGEILKQNIYDALIPTKN